jgi:chorismate synthase
MIRYLDAGESHGQALVAIIEGIPAGMILKKEDINYELAFRQRGYGRSERMKLEKDEVEILSGVRNFKTLGSPITLLIKNRVWETWKDILNTEECKTNDQITKPRPGHADLTGALKYNHKDIRNVLERSSARNTAIRVAVGAVCKKLLSYFNVHISSQVIQLGHLKGKKGDVKNKAEREKILNSSLKIFDDKFESDAIKLIDKAKKDGTTLGGIFEVYANNVVSGMGSYVSYDRKIDAKLAFAILSIQGIKAVEFGIGFKYAEIEGRFAHDEIYYAKKKGFYRRTNTAGGIEGGMTNGEEIVIRSCMKPISTQIVPLTTCDIVTKKQVKSFYERSDICVVSAASCVSEGIVAIVLASEYAIKFASDTIDEMSANYKNYLKYLENF